MSIPSHKLAPLVGADGFFKAVSARVAFMLGTKHELSLVDGSGSRSTRPSSHTDWNFDFFTNERSVGWNGYDGNPANALTFAADEPILLGLLPPCTVPLGMHIKRSVADDDPAVWIAASTGDPVDELDADGNAIGPKKINDCLLTDAALAEFPPFDLFLTNIGTKPCDPADEYSWPTVCIASADDMTNALSAHYSTAMAALQMSGSCEYWAVWAKPTAAVPANSSVTIWGDRLTAGK